jgi:hypothetical protein
MSVDLIHVRLDIARRFVKVREASARGSAARTLEIPASSPDFRRQRLSVEAGCMSAERKLLGF